MSTAAARWREMLSRGVTGSSDGLIRLMAESLRRGAEAQDPRTTPVFREVLDHLGPERTVADIGAGVGRYALPLAEAGCRVWAVEPSAEMCSHLDQARGERGLEARVQIVAGAWPGARVPPVEVALASLVIHFSREPVAFLRAMDAAATRRCVLSIHVEDPAPSELRELWATFHPDRPAPRRPRFADLYPLMIEEGITADVRIVEATTRTNDFWTNLDQVRQALAVLLQIERDEAACAHLTELLAARLRPAEDGRLSFRLPQVREAVVSWMPRAGPG